MKAFIQQEIKTALSGAGIPLPANLSIQVDYTREKNHGDFSSNVAMLLAKTAKKAPSQIAKEIQTHFDCTKPNSIIEKVEIAGPGFINFFIKKDVWRSIIDTILTKKKNFGSSKLEKKTILVEFVSANPTGPLHVGHGRGAAYGDALVRLLKVTGHEVNAEYYVNDAGRQMDILATSVWLRYLEICGDKFSFPTNAYQGNYIFSIANKIFSQKGKIFCRAKEQVFAQLPLDAEQGGDKEIYIDALIQRAKTLLGLEDYKTILSTSLHEILADIKEDLHAFRVDFDDWFSEQILFDKGWVKKVIECLTEKGFTYKESGALWFKSTHFGDDKDRVLIRENGQFTYFAADAAYRYFILKERKIDKMINILGADHHGYTARIHAVVQALGYPKDRILFLLVQFATLYRGEQRIQMSTRSGEFVTLRELREEVGTDAARFFYVLRRVEQHMDFDLELAKEQSNANPVYYVQYVYARICSVFRQLAVKNWHWNKKLGSESYGLLIEEQEQNLLVLLNRYPETIEQSASHYEPHNIAHYLRELAQAFHTYYNQHVFLLENEAVRNARLNLIAAVQQVVENGLNLLGVQTLEVM